MDYPGHIWSHGLPFAERESELDEFFRGDGNWPALARRMGVTHIYWGEDEKRKYAAFNPEWQYRLKNVSRSATVGVYEVP